MTRGSVRWLVAAWLALACLIALPGHAGADDAQKFTIVGPESDQVTEGGTATYTISLTEGTDADATVKIDAAPTGGTSASDLSFTPETLTVLEGESKSFTVQATQDTSDELNEPFTVTLSDPVRATIETGSVTTTIVDDDTPALSINDAAPVEEGGQATFAISLAPAAASPVTVSYQTANGSAVAPGDFTAKPGTQITFDPGETSKNVTVQTNDELPALDEDTENFTVTLSSASNASIADGAGTGTITDDDPEPSIKPIADVTVAEGNTGTVDAVLTVELSAASGKTVTVLYTTVPGTATDAAPGDYQSLSGSLVFAPGQTSKTITVKVIADTVFEPNEKFSVALTDPDNAGPEPDNRGEVTITDDDASPMPAVSNPSVPEGNSALTDLVFDVTLACPRPAVTFNYRTVADTATGSDFTEVGGSQLTFQACTGTASTTLKITIKVKGDTLDEFDESFNLELFNPTTGAVIKTAKGTITNDDNNSRLSIGDATADEPGTMTFTVTLSQASDRTVTVSWATADGTATAGADYTAGNGVLTFAAGETSKAIGVPVIGDTTNEENETLKVNLSSPTGVPEANLIDPQGDGTIVDKNAPPSLSINDVLVREGEGANFTVTLAGTTLRTVTVRFSTGDGSATAGADYTARVGTLSFAPGERSKAVSVTVLDDAAAEPTENFLVTLGDATNGSITKSRGVASIEPSDQVATPTSTNNTPPVAKPTQRLVPRMILGPRTVLVGPNGLARMLVTCQKLSPIACAGTVELQRQAKPLLRLGTKTFTVKKGAKGYASIKLTARGLAILRKKGTLRAKVIVLVKTSTKTMKVSPGIITLKGTKAFLNAKPKLKPKPTQVVVDP